MPLFKAYLVKTAHFSFVVQCSLFVVLFGSTEYDSNDDKAGLLINDQ